MALAATRLGSHSLKVKGFSSFSGLKWGVACQLSVPFMFPQLSLALQWGLFLLLCFLVAFQFTVLQIQFVQNSTCSGSVADSHFTGETTEPDKMCPLPDGRSGIVCVTV